MNQQSIAPWGPERKLKWFTKQIHHRSYANDVLARLDSITKRPTILVETYGSLSLDPDRYPLYAVRSRNTQDGKPWILITGGVHGYETSGVKGALKFIEENMEEYSRSFNLVVAPCISPWSYETINRLDPVMENPNREFKVDGKAEESRLLMNYFAKLNLQFDGHIDLHETTDSDRTFIPEEYAKNGLVMRSDEVHIPDGYYLIGVKGHKRAELESAIIARVREVTHIAAADSAGQILDLPVAGDGVVHAYIPGLCAQYTSATERLGAFTTEMYPDSPKFKNMSSPEVEEVCNRAQVASVIGALDHWCAAQAST